MKMFNAVYLLANKFILRCSYKNKFPNLTAFKKMYYVVFISRKVYFNA